MWNRRGESWRDCTCIRSRTGCEEKDQGGLLFYSFLCKLMSPSVYPTLGTKSSVTFVPTAVHLLALSKGSALGLGWTETKSPCQKLSLISLTHSLFIPPASVWEVSTMCQLSLTLFLEPSESRQCAYLFLVMSSLRSCIIPSQAESCICHKIKILRTGIQFCISFA